MNSFESATRRERREPQLEQDADYYQRLGVDQKASRAEIAAAFRNLSKILHPDSGGSDEEKMKLASEAYNELKDLDKRASYTSRLSFEQQKAFERLQDLGHLPTRAEVRKGLPSFQSKIWTDDEGRELRASTVSNEDFSKVFQGRQAYEFLNKEFVSALADVVEDHFTASDNQKSRVILEIGAGDGRLAHFLDEELDARMPGTFKVIATDSGKNAIRSVFNNVESLDYKSALEKYKPNIVLSSWMPHNEDWSGEIRKCPSVEEYILIGEPGGATGDAWETWGEQWTQEFEDSEGNPVPQERPMVSLFVADGFQMQEVLHASNAQINRSDGVERTHSGTYSFRKEI